MIFCGKYRTIPGFMFSDSPSQVICNTDVQRRIVVAGHDISVICFVHSFINRFFELRSQNDRKERDDIEEREDSIATPCSVNTKGLYFTLDPLPGLSKVTNCDLEEFTRDLVSSRVNSNIKSDGKREIFLRTACLSARVSTWYNLARSKSSITFFPRISWIRS